MTTHIIVIGAGMVGDTVARALSACDGIAVTAIDPKQRAAEKSYRLAELLTTEIPPGDFYFVCVDTPQAFAGQCDTSNVVAAIDSIADHIDARNQDHWTSIAARRPIIVIKSTVPVGACDHIVTLLKDRIGNTFELISSPEFLREAHRHEDFSRPDRIVIGVDTGNEKSDAASNLLALYHRVMPKNTPVFIVDRKTAEAIKYASNAMLAARIAAINELAAWAAAKGANPKDMVPAVAADHRIGPIYASPGFGGNCLPKDLEAVLHSAQTPVPLLWAAKLSNDKRLAGKI